MLRSNGVGVVLGVGAVADDEDLDVFKEAGSGPEAISLVAVYLVESLTDVYSTALELHMD